MNQKVSGYSSALLMLNVPYPSIGLTEGSTPVGFVAACTYPSIVLTRGGSELSLLHKSRQEIHRKVEASTIPF
jgi:hypothetical protein